MNQVLVDFCEEVVAMAPSTPKKSSGGAQAYPAELSFQSLKNCLVNLPSRLVSVLVDTNTVSHLRDSCRLRLLRIAVQLAQNVVVELTYRQNATQSTPTKSPAKPIQRSIYVGWTGMASKPKLASVIGDKGLDSRSKDIATVEIDTTFAKLLGLQDGQKVCRVPHTQPHTS